MRTHGCGAPHRAVVQASKQDLTEACSIKNAGMQGLATQITANEAAHAEHMRQAAQDLQAAQGALQVCPT